MRFLPPLAALLLASQSVAAAGPGTSGVQSKSRCTISYEGAGPTEHCFVSFYRLIAEPDLYDGKQVSVVGYLLRRNGMLALVPSREHVQTRPYREEIRLSPIAALAGKIIREKEGQAFVVTGVFDANVHETQFASGLIRVTDYHSPEGFRPAPPFVKTPPLPR